MQGANRQYRKVSGPAAEMKEGFIYSTEISTTGAAIAADTNTCSARSGLRITRTGWTYLQIMQQRWSAGSFLPGIRKL